MKVLFVGDVFGRAGRKAVHQLLPRLCHEHAVEFCIVNGENTTHGKGLNPRHARALLQSGADVITMGNHTWDDRDLLEYIDHEPRIIRPENFPASNPGRGWITVETDQANQITVVQVQGRVFMRSNDCPFHTMDRVLKTIAPIPQQSIFVDFHAEATSEKITLGRYLDGRVTAVIGTHTHVQTADEQVSPKGTAYITDVGMTGAHDSVIGCDTEIIFRRMIEQLPAMPKPACNDVRLSAVVLDINPQTNLAVSIKRIQLAME